MGLFDKVKEKASDALEQGKEAAQTQQLKLQLRKLEGEVESAQRRASARRRSICSRPARSSTGSELGALAARVREARAAVEAKKAEIASAAATTTTSDARRDGDRQS